MNTEIRGGRNIDIDYVRAWQDDTGQQENLASTSTASVSEPLTLNDVGDVKLTQDSQNPGYQTLTDKNGNMIDKLSGTASLITENVKAGFAEVASLVSPSIKTEIISPLPGSDLVIDLTNRQPTTDQPTSGFGKLLVKGRNGETVFSLDEAGNATVSGELAAEEVEAPEIIAGKIYADEIIARTGAFADLASNTYSGITREEIEALLAEAETDRGLLAQAQNWEFTTATGSASLNELALENLYVTGTAAINSLSVTDTIVVGSDLVLSSRINELTNQPINSLDSINSPLSIQSSGAQPLYLMAGLVNIDTQGNVEIAGDLAVAGDITASGLTLQSQ